MLSCATDRLIGNPYAQPPLPSDWEVHPTYPRRVVPYFLAPLWDVDVAARRADAEQRRARTKQDAHVAEQGAMGQVTKDLRQSLKRARAARGLLQELEEEVRKFAAGWEKKQAERRRAGLHDADSDEEELVFVGRNGAMHDLPPSPKAGRHPEDWEEEDWEEGVLREKLVYGGLEGDRHARFG